MKKPDKADELVMADKQLANYKKNMPFLMAEQKMVFEVKINALERTIMELKKETCG